MIKSEGFRLYIFLIAMIMLICGCEEKIKPSITNTKLGQDIPTQESWDARIIFTNSGKITGILKAGHIAMYAAKKYTILDSNITVDFFDENEKHTSILTAQRGKVNDVTKDFEANEHVVVISDSGTTLRTEELYWDNTNRKIHTPAFVEIISPKEQIQGHGLISDQSLKNYTILKVIGQAKMNE